MTKWTAAGVAAVTALALAAGTFGTTYAAGDGGAAVGAAANAQTSGGATQSGQAAGDAAAAPVAASCDAVTTWADLKDCVEGGSSVKLAGMIAADGDDATANTITVKEKSNVSIGVADGKKSEEVGITGTKNADGTAARLRTASVFTVPANATLTINGGTYKDLTSSVDGTLAYINGTGVLNAVQGKFEGNKSSGSGGVFRADAGSTVTFGTKDQNEGPVFSNNTAVNGGVMYSRGMVTVYGGSFHDNVATGAAGGQGGGVFHLKEATSTMAVTGGTFADNRSPVGGAIFVQGGPTLSIKGGTFSANLAIGAGEYRGGGAIYAKDATVRVTGGEFLGNGQDPITDPKVPCDPNSTTDVCRTRWSGGGAIYSTSTNDKKTGKLIIQGGVVFRGNYAKARSWFSGGGAVWAKGNLWIRNSADAKATKPVFSGNWAAVEQPTAESNNEDVPTELTTPATSISAGGAGGAVFLDEQSTAYITGGDYVNNASGYLGGGIYTEQHTTTYVGRAVAYQNTAGHFGGGLWFCPSGNSAASKGGNIALFDNVVNDDLDANQQAADPNNGIKEGNKSNDKSYTMAGDDLSIMSPWYKSDDEDIKFNTFQLMDTWFTDRNDKVVDWYHDGTPKKESSGFADGWMPGGSRQNSVETYQGDQDYPQRYSESSTTNQPVRITDNHAVTLCLYYTSGKKGQGNTQSECPSGSATFSDRGLALKAVNVKDTDKANAKEKAQISINGNGSRMSGGGFGSNGVVIFDSPYSMNWQKADASTSTNGKIDLVQTTSTWTLSTSDNDLTGTGVGNGADEKTPYLSSDLRPAQCQQSSSQNCWTHDNEGNWIVDIIDNGIRDNDGTFGSISIDNLAPGKYYLQEKEAPAGYQLSTTKYTFTITAAGTDNKIPDMPKLLIVSGTDDGKGTLVDDGRTIGDHPVNGELQWTKTDGDSNPIDGSEWKILHRNGDADGQVVSGYDSITDRTSEGEQANTPDTNATAGKFAIKLGATGTGLPAGDYTLVETKAPDGYWMPTTVRHEFTVVNADKTNLVATWNGNATGQIVNVPTSISWTKVDAGATDTSADSALLGGAEWTLTKVQQFNTDGKTLADINANAQPKWTVKDCVDPDTNNYGGCTTTSDNANATDPAKNQWADADTVAGQFKLNNLLPGKYELIESKAPDGFVKTDTVYEFVIGMKEPGANQHVVLCPGKNDATDATKCLNSDAVTAIPNAKAVSVLPFTGGTGLGRLLMGGGFAAAAALAAAVTYEWRRRRALDM